MIISEQWLREWVNPNLDTQALADQLTMAGLEVDAVTPVAQDFSGVVVAEIVSAEQHPNADKLRVCEVAAGSDTVQIVCGAPNARAGLKAPLAMVGAVLPGDFKIKKAKLRGVESQGMLCAEAELTISDENSGLMELAADAPVGASLREYLGLDDHMIEIGLTPNRADCLSIQGIARDVAVLNGAQMCSPVIEPVAVTCDETLPVEVRNSEKCPRYLGRVIRDVDVTRSTPLWMSERLRRAGVRSIDPVVDVTNYVMLELGQPMHAFDKNVLKGGVVVREAEPGEKLVLLDGSEQTLTEGTLVIADHEKPLAMGGIMGGEHSGVSSETKHLFLESAFFAPQPMAGRARSYGLHTDSSHRYERGVDPELAYKAMERATQLLLDIVGGTAGPVTDVSDAATLPQPATVELRPARIERVLGFAMPGEAVERILTGLGFTVKAIDTGWQCTAPSWRFDVSQEADLIEELARVHGYNNLPVSRIDATLAMQSQPESRRSLRVVKQSLTARGFYEAITFSFVAPEQQTLFDPALDPVVLKNPISADLAVMRTSLMPGLLKILSHNVNRQQARVRVFESGLRFVPGGNGELLQKPTIALAITGTRTVEGWSQASERVDFYDLKGEVEQLLAPTSGVVTFEATTRAGLHDGQTAAVSVNGAQVGVLGALHPATAEALDLPAATFVAELDMDAVLACDIPAFDEISRFPEVRRDIAVLVSDALPAADVLAEARSAAGEHLRALNVFDVYAGQGVPEGQKSLAVSLTFRDDERTLDDSEVAQAMAQVVDCLKEKFNAELRS
jgi:phenylalanyl-tRNA synthetase beta chain